MHLLRFRVRKMSRFLKLWGGKFFLELGARFRLNYTTKSLFILCFRTLAGTQAVESSSNEFNQVESSELNRAKSS